MSSESSEASPPDLRIANRYHLPPGALASFNLRTAPTHHSSPKEGEATLIDLSISGCKLRSDSSLATSIYYSLILHLPTYPRPINVSTATIRWVDACTYGIRFTHLEIHDVEHLHTFLIRLHTDQYGLAR